MEEKVNKLIGKIVHLERFEGFETSFSKLARSISPNYQNITQVNSNGLLVKYGFVDLTYFEIAQNTYLKIFGKTDKCGVEYFKSVEEKYENFVSYYKKHIEAIDSLFPLEIKIIDCCKTDHPEIWDDKYFYI